MSEPTHQAIKPKNSPQARTTDQDILLVDRDQGIATLTLNRPDKFNVLSEELLEHLLHALQAIQNDDTVSVVVLAANGRAFCAGHDLRRIGLQYYVPGKPQNT